MNFVDDDRSGKPCEKLIGILRRQFTGGKIFEVRLCVVWEKDANKRRFSALARAEQGDRRVFSHLGLDIGGYFAIDHALNIHNFYGDVK